MHSLCCILSLCVKLSDFFNKAGILWLSLSNKLADVFFNDLDVAETAVQKLPSLSTIIIKVVLECRIHSGEEPDAPR